MLVQDNTKEKPVTGAFGAAAAAREAVQVSSLHKKCNELALLPRTIFGASRERDYNLFKLRKKLEMIKLSISVYAFLNTVAPL